MAARTVTDAQVVDAVRDIAWTTKVDSDGVLVRRLSPEGLYGRRKMTAYLRRTSMPEASFGAVDRAMRTLGLSGVRRDKGTRTTIPAKDGNRAGDLLDRDFTAAAPNRTWVTDFTYVRTWAGFVYVAFILDVYAQRIVAWHAATTKQTDLVMIPLRMALWQRDREGNPTTPGELIHHSDAGSQYTSLRLTEHLALEEIRPSIGSVGDAYDNALMESDQRPLQGRVHPHHGLPRRPLQDHRRRRVRHRRLGRLVQQPQAPLDPGKRSRRSSTSKPTTLLSTESRTPYRNGREPRALQTPHECVRESWDAWAAATLSTQGFTYRACPGHGGGTQLSEPASPLTADPLPNGLHDAARPQGRYASLRDGHP